MQKVCENVLPYIFYYSGVSINNFLALDTFSYGGGMYMTFFIIVESPLTKSLFRTHSLIMAVCTLLHGVPIMKNVRRKVCENFLPYVFYYSGVNQLLGAHENFA